MNWLVSPTGASIRPPASPEADIRSGNRSPSSRGRGSEANEALRRGGGRIVGNRRPRAPHPAPTRARKAPSAGRRPRRPRRRSRRSAARRRCQRSGSSPLARRPHPRRRDPSERTLHVVGSRGAEDRALSFRLRGEERRANRVRLAAGEGDLAPRRASREKEPGMGSLVFRTAYLTGSPQNPGAPRGGRSRACRRDR